MTPSLLYLSLTALYVYQSAHLSLSYFFISIPRSVSLSVHHSLSLSICLSVSLFVSITLDLSFSLFIFLSLSLVLSLSLPLSVFVCLSLLHSHVLPITISFLFFFSSAFTHSHISYFDLVVLYLAGYPPPPFFSFAHLFSPSIPGESQYIAHMRTCDFAHCQGIHQKRQSIRNLPF